MQITYQCSKKLKYTIPPPTLPNQKIPQKQNIHSKPSKPQKSHFPIQLQLPQSSSPSPITHRESFIQIQKLVDETTIQFKKTPVVISKEDRRVFLQNLRKSHRSLYFCIAEIAQTLDNNGEKFLSKLITSIFTAFNELFEGNNGYYEKTINYFKKLEKREQMIKQFKFERKFNFFTGLGGGGHEARESTELAQQLHLSNTEILRLKYELIEQKKLNRAKNEALAEAVRDYREHGMDAVYKDFNFTDEVTLGEKESKRMKAFHKKVNRCMSSIHDYQDDYLELVYDPRVILEVNKRVYDKMISQFKTNIKSLNSTISRLSQYHGTQPTTIKELKNLAKDMRAHIPEIQEQDISYVPMKILREDYSERVLNDTEKGLKHFIGKKNEQIAFKAVQIYQKMMYRETAEATMQTDQDPRLKFLEDELNFQKENRKVAERKVADQRSKEIDSRAQLIKEHELENKFKQKRISQLSYRLSEFESKLMREKVDTEQNAEAAKRMRIELKNLKEQDDHLVKLTDRLITFLNKIHSGMDEVSRGLSHCFTKEIGEEYKQKKKEFDLNAESVQEEEGSKLRYNPKAEVNLEAMIDLTRSLASLNRSLSSTLKTDLKEKVPNINFNFCDLMKGQSQFKLFSTNMDSTEMIDNNKEKQISKLRTRLKDTKGKLLIKEDALDRANVKIEKFKKKLKILSDKRNTVGVTDLASFAHQKRSNFRKLMLEKGVQTEEIKAWRRRRQGQDSEPSKRSEFQT